MHAMAAAWDSEFICFQYGCFYCPEKFPEDILIKKLLLWRIVKCFFCESWPRTRGTEENVCTAYGELVFQAISPFSNSPFTLVQGCSQTHIQRTKNDNKKTWQDPSMGPPM